MKSAKHMVVAVAVCAFNCVPTVQAVTAIFFDSSQATNLVSTNATSDTIASAGYLFTYSRDKFFTGGTTNPPGRNVRVFWPDGLEAQYVTAGPNPDKARITIRRVDGAVFDLTAFSAKLLANPGAGRAIEIVPFLNGQEPLNDPLVFDVSSGFYGSVHHFDASTPAYIGSTAALTNYDAYVLSLTLDFALVSLTVVDASLPPPPPPMLQISVTASNFVRLSWPTNDTGFTLQQNSNLGTTNWASVTNAVSIVDADYETTVPLTSGPGFFRLKQP